MEELDAGLPTLIRLPQLLASKQRYACKHQPEILMLD
jgi:hypothetical protein